MDRKLLTKLMLLMTQSMSFDEIANELSNCLNEYKLIPTEENKAKIMYNCSLLSIKDNQEAQGIEEVAKRLELLEKGEELLTVKSKN